ncbi:F-box/kelch-repeat protein At5g26960 [Beta vulgaris subsp. vulgaris]|uniref:F-box/kelch-repeat protein At5g26960 n=1 Tax=Beta vulgaris subsp. vulgaris TaxID=3555 RepID=UPI002037427D|nr:F-box/kelch-repeat protein At5g26960 [Beta vulgaris subsp. vulgaris]
MAVVERERDNCNSRHFSLLIKSCCPNPNNPSNSIIPFPPNNNNNNNNKTPKKLTSLKTCISSLPDDILYEILSRVPLSSLPSISAVCRRWAHLLHSHTFSLLRRHHRLVHSTVFAFSLSSISTLRVLNDEFWKVPAQNDVVLGGLRFHTDLSHARLAAIGRKVFIISRSSALVFDPWTGLAKTRSGPLFPRKRFAAAAVCGRIYVAGGSLRASAVEEYDPHADEWRVVSNAPRRRYGCVGVGVDGVFYVIGGLMIGGASELRAAEARVCASSMDLYDVVGRGWLRSRAVPGGGCVVAACGADGCVYVLASHAVELSFWRFNGRRKGESGGGFGEWCRMRSPPLPAQVKVDGTVRFSCVGVEDKVVLIQVMGCIDDLLRRSGRNVRGYKEGLVLIFDCGTEEWSRGPDLPEVVQRAACVCVEC